MRHPTACCYHHNRCHTIMRFYFGAADLQLLLATAGVRNIMLAGVTTDVCVHTTMRVCIAAQHLQRSF
jgi:nicotinamidase-related amidase